MTPRKKARHKPEDLNVRQQALIREFAMCGDREEAELRAGYQAGHGNAHRILNDPRAKAILAQHKRKADELAGIHLAWIKANLKKIAQGNLYGILKTNPDGTVFLNDRGAWELDPAKLTAEQMFTVSEFGFDADGRLKLKFYDKAAVLRFLHDDQTPERAARVRIEGKDGGPVEIIEGLGARLNAARQRRAQRAA